MSARPVSSARTLRDNMLAVQAVHFPGAKFKDAWDKRKSPPEYVCQLYEMQPAPTTPPRTGFRAWFASKPSASPDVKVVLVEATFIPGLAPQVQVQIPVPVNSDQERSIKGILWSH